VSLGCRTVVQQSEALGVRRSTAWTILRAAHKSSGLSAHVINQMLASPALPNEARQKIIEYIRERAGGMYGHSRPQCKKLLSRLVVQGQEPPAATQELLE